MSDNNTQQNNSEEVDLGQLFNAIGKLFERFFKFIGSIFVAIFSVIIFALQAIIQNIKIILLVVIVAFIIGIAIDKTKQPLYYGNMLVEPYFESEHQLFKNIEYYNSLLDTQNFDALSKIFQIPEDHVRQIVSFDLEKGPETENYLLQEYDEYIRSVDSLSASEMTFKNYKKNRDLFSSKIFSVEVFSRKNDIFRDLSNGFMKSFENEYSLTLKKRRDSVAKLKKTLFERSLRQIDSMRLVYLRIKEEEAKNKTGKLGFSGMVPVSQEKTDTKEYELLNNQLSLRDSIRKIEQTMIEKNVYYDIVSKFPEVGVKDGSISNRYSLFFPIIGFVLLCLLFIVTKIVNYVKNYKY